MRIKGIAKISAAALVCALAFAATAYGAAVPPDAVGRSYEKAVSTLADRDIVTGDVDGLFYPDSNLTRAQFCTIIVKAMRAPAATVNGTPSQDVKKSGFPDLSGYAWAEGYISYAVDKGVVTGYPDGSFKPGNNVNMNELITMTLRAAGYSDAALGGVWPENYVAKAGDIGALTGLTAPLPEYATKWMAAQLIYNVLSRIEEANPPETAPPEGDASPAETPAASAITFVTGAFDADITTFAGKSFASDVKVLRYGLKADYSKDMTLPENAADYLEDTIYKYKDVETPAWCEFEGDKIKRLILPRDVGFSGRAYGVIKNIVSVTDSQGGAADGFVMLAAGRAVTWAGDPGLAKENVPSKDRYDGGQLFELQLRNGQATSAASAVNESDKTKFGKPRVAIPGEVGSKGKFTEIVSKTGNVVTLDSGDGDAAIFEIKDKAAVYFLGADGEYSVGTLSAVREKAFVRLYDVSDNEDKSVDVVIVREE
ncbi:MAG: S-layer homology domain-containing protein [Clostridiales Family XIII bacterium]|jgi:hypothetical protein|nr:S-layer homology domain-containing protein [Clostridiales Family XIII bacterium]